MTGIFGLIVLSLIAFYMAQAAYSELREKSDSRFIGFLIAVLMIVLTIGVTGAEPIRFPLIYLQAYFFGLGLAAKYR